MASDHQQELAMRGLCQSVLEGPQVVISINEIANNRDNDNLSGTLAIELWALKKPYEGGEFQGQVLASTTIGELQGQHCLSNCRYQLNYQPAEFVQAEVCLMLREWAGDEGYVTQDYVTLSVESSSNDDTANPNESAISYAELAGQYAEASEDSKETAGTVSKVSINSGSYEDLHAVKGINKKLAQRIIAGRPYRKKKALLQLPAINKKKFKKIKPKLRK
ncbi:hypothetical protein GCM10025791_26800 [Halioxenophilus aromaticivorans]|uniref:Uncharacterized protein n=2 Tax=Halioxenophilus aromaticivorans TaxID=1306992 RepID=A0AAV3U4B3_9ALTE